MELSLICPVSEIESTKLLSGRFCLANIAAKYPTYLEYFTQATADGYQVILDNGIFEDDQIAPEQFASIIETVQPAIVIAPDTIMGDAEKNLERGRKFAIGITSTFPDVKQICFVPQCVIGDLLGFQKVLIAAIEDPLFQVIGICRDAVYAAFNQYTHSQEQEVNRYFFSCWAQKEGYIQLAQSLGKKWHFLGVGDHWHLLQYYWFVDYMDTASLFWNSINGVEMKNGVFPTMLRRPLDYFFRDYNGLLTEEILELLIFNCQQAQQYVDKANALARKLKGKRI